MDELSSVARRTHDKAYSLLQEKADPVGAINEFKKLMQLKIPNYIMQATYRDLGYAYVNAGLIENAVEIWREGMNKFPPWNELDDQIRYSYNRAGWANWKIGKIEESIKCFEKSIETNSNYYKLNPNSSSEKIYEARGEHSLMNLFADACKGLGIIYFEKNQPHRAIPFFKRAKQLNLSIVGVKTRLKQAIQQNNRVIEVDPIIELIPELSPFDSIMNGTAKASRDEEQIVPAWKWKEPHYDFLWKYARSPYYQKEVEMVKQYWSKDCSNVLRKSIEKYRWHYVYHITDEIIKVLPRKDFNEIKNRFEGTEFSWHNAIMHLAIIKKKKLKISYAKPTTKTCKFCHKNFFEGDIQISIFDFLIRATNQIDYCSRCLSAAFYGAYKTKKSVESLKQDLVNLVEELGFIPPQNIFNNRNFIEKLPKERLHKIIPALINITHPEIYEKKFGSWFEALIASATLNETSQRLVFGTLCIANDGHKCRSIAEKIIDDWLFKNQINHIIEPYYPTDNSLNPNGLMRADWKVEDFFIECFGLEGIEEYDEKIELKRDICKKHGIKLIEITMEKLHNLDEEMKILKVYTEK